MPFWILLKVVKIPSGQSGAGEERKRWEGRLLELRGEAAEVEREEKNGEKVFLF